MRSMKLLRNIHSCLIIIFLLSGIESINAQVDTLSHFTKSVRYPLDNLRIQLDDIFNDPNFSNATWGVLIKSLKTGEILYKKNENKLFIPASVMKLFTSASSLLLLGSNYHYKTKFYTNGVIKRNKLEGDLIIRGVGDPTFSNRFYNSTDDIFNAWSDSLKLLGITEIAGDIIGDDNLFDDIAFGKGWAWDYEGNWFAAPSSALSFNDNSVDIMIEPSSIDMPAYVSISPQTKFVDIINNVKTVGLSRSDAIRVYRGKGKNLITVYGTIKEDAIPITKYVSVDNPTMYTITTLYDILIENGINILGSPKDFDETLNYESYDGFLHLFTHTSPMLKEIIKEINKNSNNFCAEQLLKTLGMELFGYGSIDNGVKGMTDILKVVGINPANMIIADGSGLSRLNLLTPKQIVSLLNYMYKSNEFENFYESLPIAGIDGTLAGRMSRTATENNVRAKPGYIDGVNSLAGYMKTTDGEKLAFAIIVNNFLVPTNLANYIQDMVCASLANFSRK